MTAFRGKKVRHPSLIWLGVLVLLAAAAAAVALVVRLHGGAERYVPWIVMGAFVVFLGCMFGSMVPRPATLEVAGDELRPSWRGPVARGGRPAQVGRWVMAALDVPVGLAVHAGGLRIGAREHAGDGYRVEAAPTRAVDFELSAADLDAFLAALGVARTPASGELTVELVRSSQSAGGMLRTMFPWLLTIVALSVAGAALSTTGVADRLARTPHGMLYLGLGTGAVVLLGLVWTVVRSLRPRRPELELRVGAYGVTLVEPGGREVAGALWSALRAEPRKNVIRTRGAPWIMPALALAIGDRTLVVGCWDHRDAWPVEAPRATPTWLVGRPHWLQLVAALRAHGHLR